MACKRIPAARDGERTRLGCSFPRSRGKHWPRRNSRNFFVRHTRKRLDARRVQQHPGAGVLPNFRVRLKGVTRDVPDRHLAVGNPSQIRPLKNMPPAAA